MSGLVRVIFLLVCIDVIGGYISSPYWIRGGYTCLGAARLHEGKSPPRPGGRGAVTISSVSMLDVDGQDGGGRSMNELDRAKEALAKLMERKRVHGDSSAAGSSPGASSEPPSERRAHVAVQDRPRSSSPFSGSVDASRGTARPPSRPAEQYRNGFDPQGLNDRGVQGAMHRKIRQQSHGNSNRAVSSVIRTPSPPVHQESGVKNQVSDRGGEQGAQGRSAQSASHQKTLDEIKKIVNGLKEFGKKQQEQQREQQEQQEREIKEIVNGLNEFGEKQQEPAGKRVEPEKSEGRNSQGATFFRNAAKLTAEAIRKNGGRDNDDIEYRNFQKRLSRDPNQEAMLKYLEDAGLGSNVEFDVDPNGKDPFSMAFGQADNVPRRNVARKEVVKDDRETAVGESLELDPIDTDMHHDEFSIPTVVDQVTEGLSTSPDVLAWNDEVIDGYRGDLPVQTRGKESDLRGESPRIGEGVDNDQAGNHFDELLAVSSHEEPELIGGEPQVITAFQDKRQPALDWENALEGEMSQFAGSSNLRHPSAISLGSDLVENYGSSDGSMFNSQHRDLANFGSFDQELGLQWKNSPASSGYVSMSSSLSSLENSLVSAFKLADGWMRRVGKDQTAPETGAIGDKLAEAETQSVVKPQGQMTMQQVDPGLVDVKSNVGTTSVAESSDALKVSFAGQGSGASGVAEEDEDEYEDEDENDEGIILERDVVGSADWEDELDDEDDLYDELENEFLTQSVDEGDYDMFVVYVKSDRIGIRTAWPDGFETMEEFYLDQSTQGRSLEEDDIDDSLIRSALGPPQKTRVELEVGATSQIERNNTPASEGFDVAVNGAATASSPAKYSTSTSHQLSDQDVSSQSTSPPPFRPTSPNAKDLPGLDVGAAVRITSRNCRHKDMVGTLVSFVGNGKRARVKVDGVEKTLLLQVNSLVPASLDPNDRSTPGLRDRTVPPAVLNSKTAWAWWKVRGGSSGP